MQNRLEVTFLGLCLLAAVYGCATATVVNPGGPTIAEARSEPAIGDKLRVAVMAFDNKTQYEVGDGLRAVLTSTLFRTGKFIVLEREELGDVREEQELAARGVVRRDTAPPSGQVEGAQILIYGVVTAFEPGQRGFLTGFGGARQSHVAIDLRLVDSTTARVVATATVEGQATDAKLTLSDFQYGYGVPLLTPALTVWANTPVEKALRICIEKAVAYIVGKLA